MTAPDASQPPDEQLRGGIDAFLRYAEEHSQGFLTAYRGSLAGDPEVRAIVEEGRLRQSARIINIVVGDSEPPPLVCLAVQGWIAFAQNVDSSRRTREPSTSKRPSAAARWSSCWGVPRRASDRG